MTLEEFRATFADSRPPNVSAALRALWHAARHEWDAAHAIAQDIDSKDGAWVHAYLHRREGDLPNARWWYKEAKRPVATGSLDDEWKAILRALLNEG